MGWLVYLIKRGGKYDTSWLNTDLAFVDGDSTSECLAFIVKWHSRSASGFLWARRQHTLEYQGLPHATYTSEDVSANSLAARASPYLASNTHFSHEADKRAATGSPYATCLTPPFSYAKVACPQGSINIRFLICKVPGKKNRQKKQKARAAWYPLVAKSCSRLTGQQFATSYVGNYTSISSQLSDHPIGLSDQPGNSTGGTSRIRVGASRTKTGLWYDSGLPKDAMY